MRCCFDNDECEYKLLADIYDDEDEEEENKMMMMISLLIIFICRIYIHPHETAHHHQVALSLSTVDRPPSPLCMEEVSNCA